MPKIYNRNNTVFFALHGSQTLATNVASILDIPLTLPEERDFDGGEHKTRSLTDVVGKQVFVLHSLAANNEHSVNDKLCRLLFFVGSLKDAGAESVHAITPYLAYSRKDRRTKERDPVTTRYIANLFRAVGTDSLITVDIHNQAAFDNAFQIHTQNINTDKIFIDYFTGYFSLNPKTDTPITILAPDVGAIKRVEKFRQALSSKLSTSINTAFITKQRSRDVVESSNLHGDVERHSVIVYDDMICSGTTILNAIHACERGNAKQVFAAATHGIFQEPAKELFSKKNGITAKVVVTNSVEINPDFAALNGHQLTVLDCSPFIAAALLTRHSNMPG